MQENPHITEFGITQTPQSEFDTRLGKVDAALQKAGAGAMVFFSAAAITYLTGSPLVATERPMAFVYQPGGASALLVPRLEAEHAAMQLPQYRIAVYPEYPGERHPMHYLADLLRELGLAGAGLAADSDGYPPVYGYSGPALSEVLGRDHLILLPRLIQQLKVHKSEYEISLIRESARWSNYAMTLLQEYTKPGLREYEVSFRAGFDAVGVMLKTLGHRYRPNSLSDSSVLVGYRGQIGPHSYYPHAVTTNAAFARGDVLGCYATADIGGYICELERNFFMGEPTAEQRRYYLLAQELQQVAFAALRPGAACSDVDRATRKFFKDNHIEQHWRHHTGHCLGSGMHETPVLDIGEDHPLLPGMCFSVEPGIYVQGVGGFRLSDTVVIREHGIERITYFSRELADMIIDC